MDKYGFWGLMIFVAIPLPGTGAYSGSIAALILGMNKVKAFISISLGVIIAGYCCRAYYDRCCKTSSKMRITFS